MTAMIRWGILSTANIAYRRVVPALQAARNGTVQAVASRSLEKAQTFAAERSIPQAYGSYEALLADPNIDAIYIPLPNSEHAAWALRCAEAGKAVLCEKPLARTADEAQQMVAAFAARGVLLVEGMMYRFHPQTERVQQLLAEGAIGRLAAISAGFTYVLRSEANIRVDAALGGGALLDVGCYCVSLMRLLTGAEPQSGQALANFATGGVDDAMAGVLRFSGGVLGHFDVGMRAYRTNFYELRGTDGRIAIDKGFTMEANEEHIIRLWRGDQYEEIRTPAVNHFTLMAEDFADALLTGRSPRYPAADAVGTLRVLDGLLKSARAAAEEW
jgi:predicted dehydrogenase